MGIDIERIRKRTWRYWYEDGLSEIALGGLFMALGLFFLADALLLDGPGRAFRAIGLPVLVIGGSWLGARWVQAAKERLTFPRTGYVRYPQPGPRRRLLSGAAAGLIAVLTTLLLAWAPASRAWIPALQGILIGASFLYVGQRFALARFYLLAGISAVAGAGASLAGLGDLSGSAAYFTLMGAAVAAGGGLALRRYLQQTQPVEVGDYEP